MNERIDHGTEIIPVHIEPVDVENLVYTIRGKQVMLDHYLALIYGYEVRALNQQVKRNITRFPDDFMFQLTDEERFQHVFRQSVVEIFSKQLELFAEGHE